MVSVRERTRFNRLSTRRLRIVESGHRSSRGDREWIRLCVCMGVAAGEIRDCAVDMGYSSGEGMRAVVVERNGRPCRLCVVCARVKASAKEKERAREGVEGRGAREGGRGGGKTRDTLFTSGTIRTNKYSHVGVNIIPALPLSHSRLQPSTPPSPR